MSAIARDSEARKGIIVACAKEHREKVEKASRKLFSSFG